MLQFVIASVATAKRTRRVSNLLFVIASVATAKRTRRVSTLLFVVASVATAKRTRRVSNLLLVITSAAQQSPACHCERSAAISCLSLRAQRSNLLVSLRAQRSNLLVSLRAKRNNLRASQGKLHCLLGTLQAPPAAVCNSTGRQVQKMASQSLDFVSFPAASLYPVWAHRWSPIPSELIFGLIQSVNVINYAQIPAEEQNVHA